MNDCVRITACRLCDSTDLGLIMAFAPTPPGDAYIAEPKHQRSYPLDLLTCRSCGAVQLADTVNPELIYTDYIYTTSISRGLEAHYEQYAASVVERLPRRGLARAFDIGSNDGTLLRAFQRHGYHVRGIDPARGIAEQATASGIQTHTGFFSRDFADDLSFQSYEADIITANHVMANVADLHDFAEGVKTLLAPDGTFVFETGYWPLIWENRLIDTIEHEHIHYFAVNPLRAFFERHGLRLVSVELNATKGGSMRGFARHVSGSVPDASVDRLSLEELRLTSVWLQQWAKDLEHLRAEIRHCIELKPKTERWVGYGAAVGSTLLLHQFGLGNVLTELWDDNTSRHGRFSPGLHLPVMAPNHSQADKIVILAWRYAETIMKAHPEHAGKWILPLPHLRFA